MYLLHRFTIVNANSAYFKDNLFLMIVGLVQHFLVADKLSLVADF